MTVCQLLFDVLRRCLPFVSPCIVSCLGPLRADLLPHHRHTIHRRDDFWKLDGPLQVPVQVMNINESRFGRLYQYHFSFAFQGWNRRNVVKLQLIPLSTVDNCCCVTFALLATSCVGRSPCSLSLRSLSSPALSLSKCRRVGEGLPDRPRHPSTSSG